MADDSDDEKLRGTIPFEDVEILTDGEFDPDDLLEFVDDGGDVAEATDPFLPAMTRQHPVPDELLWRSRQNDQSWVKSYAVVGRNGVLRVKADLFDFLEPGERVEIRLRRLKPKTTKPDSE